MPVTDQENIPCHHLAIIMDGNGRWAKNKHLPRVMGHNEGAKRVREIIAEAANCSIKVLTLFAFSTENWSRPAEEVSFLMQLLLKLLKKELPNFQKENIRLSFIGQWQKMPDEVTVVIQESIQLTEHNTGLEVVIALNYGGRADIVEAAKTLAKQVQQGEKLPEDIDEDSFQQHLALANYPPVDLLIRTSGEQRISNFLLWQLAYSEFYFTSIHWPDFDSNALHNALADFSKRQRRFGGI